METEKPMTRPVLRRPDDDNDGITDVDEIAHGTDPLKPNVAEAPKETPTTHSNPNEGATENTPAVPEPNTRPTAEGFEKYTPTGTIDTILSNVTSKVADAKQTIDTYRSARNKK